ncbi:MAG: prolipoprotein diacylglyceryl transferase [Lewinellaceae bacterium]|nr:prolipoprotein diacylglyceryl transferase [Lewinellaceae bacterium]
MHLLFEMLAFALGYQLYAYQRKRSVDVISDEHRLWIFIGAAAGALLGSHLLGILERPEEWHQLSLIYWLSNKTVVGGFLGGLIGVETTKKLLGIHRSSGDLMTYPILLGLFIGRLGCHVSGLSDGTLGLPSALPWAVDFGDGIRRHPVNLYEMLFIAALALFLYFREQKIPFQDGQKFKVFLIAYLFWRFFVEWLKPAYYFPFGLSSIQLACLAGLFYYRKSILGIAR